MSSRRKHPGSIRLLILDVDGVLTDGRLYFDARGEALKVFHVRDGYGIRRLIDSGVQVAVISGRRSRAVATRCRELRIRHVIQGVEDKLDAFEKLCRKLRISASECACVADDLPDLPLMHAAGIAYAVADAHPMVRRHADIVTALPGGKGAVREVCDHLLAHQTRVVKRR